MKAPSLAASRAYQVAAFVTSGLVLALLTSQISEKGFASPNAQLLPLSKYVTILGYVALEKGTRASQRRTLSRKGRVLVYTIGCLSVVAYCLYCLGFALAGTGLGLGMHAAAGQTFTAILSRAILKRKLTHMQLAAVVTVNAGLLLRSLAKPRSQLAGASEGVLLSQVLGGTAIMGSSACYALLGVVFDHLLKTEQPAPPYSQIMEIEGWLGAAVLTLWQAVYTIPNWDRVIAAPLAASGMPSGAALALLLASGCIFIWHYHNMSNMFKLEGAVAVGLVNAARGALVALLAGWLHCKPERPAQCNSFWTVSSALVVAAGAGLWVIGPKQTAQASRGASKKEE